MQRITVKIEDAKKKLYAADLFFDAMHFAIDLTNQLYCKNYYGTMGEGNSMERHMIVLKSIPITFTVES